MQLQKPLKLTGLDIGNTPPKIMRRRHASYDKDQANYTQSLGLLAWFYRQQKNDFY